MNTIIIIAIISLLQDCYYYRYRHYHFFFCMTANVFDLMLVRLFGLFTVASFSFSRNVKFLSEIFTLTGLLDETQCIKRVQLSFQQ